MIDFAESLFAETDGSIPAGDGTSPLSGRGDPHAP